MPRKKSVKRSARQFVEQADEIVAFVDQLTPTLSDKHTSWMHEYGILRLYRAFELMILDALVGAINNDTEMISARTGISFPKHLTDEVCEYLVIGDGYFNFKGRDGLISVLTRYVPLDHYLVTSVKDKKYKQTLDRLTALRNYAAHGSSVAKARVKTVTDRKSLGTSGSWLKAGDRFPRIVERLKDLAEAIEKAAPY